MSLLRLGVIGTSAKENEHRLPLHPEHLAFLEPDIRAQIVSLLSMRWAMRVENGMPSHPCRR